MIEGIVGYSPVERIVFHFTNRVKPNTYYDAEVLGESPLAKVPMNRLVNEGEGSDGLYGTLAP